MSKTVWIVHQYASTPQTGMGGRHYYLGRELAKQGYDVYVIASGSHHLLREKLDLQQAFKIETLADGFNFVWVDMPDYEGAHSRQRALNWFLFPWRIRKLARLIPKKPDVVLSSSPSPIAFLGAQHLARKFKARLVFEVRDIWPLTLTEIGGYSPKHPFIRFMQWVEDKAYRDSDAVVSNLNNAIEHMVSRGMHPAKFAWVPNGFSLDEVNQNTSLNETAAKLIPQGKFIVGYTGTLGMANALGTLIEAAECLREYSDIAFVLVGDGKDKAALQARIKANKLDNVIFIDPISKAEIQAMLSKFNVCYIGWLDEALYRFGIGANKIPEYFCSGKPVLHAYSGECDPVSEFHAGIQIPAEDPLRLADAVLRLYRMPAEERAAMGANGRKIAFEQYEYSQLASSLAICLFREQ